MESDLNKTNSDAEPQEVTPEPAPAAEPVQETKEEPKRSLYEKAEEFVSNLSTKNTFWNRLCSLIWLPYAYHSGIKMDESEGSSRAILPFRRFNKNWYNAMAGAALLGNSEIAGGNWIFKYCGGKYTVVCKHLEYRFLRPCIGPAEYQITPMEDINELIASGKEFNLKVRMDIVQMLSPVMKKKLGSKGRPKRVGRCIATFHMTPKVHHKAKKLREKFEK
ncbi:MAG TPA: hypothetical protein VIR63_06435 [Pontiella sp.]